MPCPYLGTKEDRSLMFSEPSPNNACYAQITEEKKLFRTVTMDYADIPKKTQMEWCLSEDKYAYCPYYASQSKKSGPVTGDQDPDPEPPENDDQGLKKAAILAACFVLAAALAGLLYIMMKGPSGKPKPGELPPSPRKAAAAATFTPLTVATAPQPESSPTQEPPPATAVPTTAPRPIPVTGAKADKMVEIAVASQDGVRTIKVTLNGAPNLGESKFLPADTLADKMDRVFVDLKDLRVSGKISTAMNGRRSEHTMPLDTTMEDDLIAGMRVAQNAPAPNRIARLVIDLKRPVTFSLSPTSEGFTLTLSPDLGISK